ncbi:hypothetical protein VTJ83DRAFT_4759 [Remersonia thermophila]|uniref:Cut9 interacting protein Scn1 n=1 Tax=Remersonia thermophila TaxID=72144 RepID=A0ABR4DD21_9PEZI
MCGGGAGIPEGQTPAAPSSLPSSTSSDFPWHLGVADAHCHPTDTMASIASIPSMKARVLTVMATRSQDQDLVASVASKHAVGSRAALQAGPAPNAADRVVPAFGWHPWFSYQLYDDGDDDDAAEKSGLTTEELKAKLYGAVLSPAPSDEFVAGLPDPVPLGRFLADTRRRVLDAGVAMIGEVGLDKTFRLPWPWGMAQGSQGSAGEEERRQGGQQASSELTPGGREGRMLSPHQVRMPHQVRVLEAQLRLAGELGVPVSVHGVQAHGVLFDVLAGLWKGYEKEVVSRRKQKLVAPGAEDFSSSDDDDYDDDDDEEGHDDGFQVSDGEGELGRPKDRPRIAAVAGRRHKSKPFPPRICLHSFSGSPQTLKQYVHPAVPAKVFFSFSSTINLSTAGGAGRFGDVLRACPDDRVLVESDLHCAGDAMDGALEDITRRVCEGKGWPLEEGVVRLRNNYVEFLFG